MADLEKMDPEFKDFAFRALKLGASTRNAEGQLTTFGLRDGDAAPTPFETEFVPESIEKAMAWIRVSRPKPKMAVVVFDGTIDIKGQKVDAIIAECFSAGADEALIFAQRYQASFQLASVQLVGGPTFVGTDENILK